MTTKQLALRAMAGLAVLTGAVALPAAAAGAAKEPDGHASCIGQVAAAISPPGTSEEAAGGMPDLLAFIDPVPGPRGAFISFFAQLHEASHEACDAAVE